MSRYVKVGYDHLKLYNVDELERMYVVEGHSLSASELLALTLWRGIRASIETEKRSWKEIRENEIPFGILDDSEGGKNAGS